MIRYIVFAIALLAGFGSLIAKEPPASKPKNDFRSLTGPNYEHLTLDTFTYRDAAHERKLHRMQEIAERIAGKSWEHRDWYRRRGWIVYRAWWTSLPDQFNAFGHRHHGLALPKGPFHHVSLETFHDKRKARPREIIAVGVRAGWVPVAPGWLGGIQYHDPRDMIDHSGPRMVFTYSQRKAEGKFADGVRSDEHLRRFQVTRNYGDTRYGIQVKGSPKYPTTDAEIVAVLETAEAFRDFCLNQLAALEKNVREQIPNGRGIGYRYYARDLSSFARADGTRFVAFRPKPPSSRRDLTKTEQQKLVAEAVALIERRRMLVNENFREIHAAIEKAFPLVEVLKAADALR